jgi:spore cortex formation protein SpoVR/YcgB (stage V sporulation)
LHLFAIADHTDETTLKVDSIHDERGYRRVRKLLSQQHAQENRVPDVQVVRFDRDGDRSLTLRHIRRRGRPLNEAAAEVVTHSAQAVGFPGAAGWKPGRTIRGCMRLRSWRRSNAHRRR